VIRETSQRTQIGLAAGWETIPAVECVLCGVDSPRRPPNSASLQELLDNMGYNIVMTETELNGPERFAADNVLTEKQCQALIRLANVSVEIIF